MKGTRREEENTHNGFKIKNNGFSFRFSPVYFHSFLPHISDLPPSLSLSYFSFEKPKNEKQGMKGPSVH